MPIFEVVVRGRYTMSTEQIAEFYETTDLAKAVALDMKVFEDDAMAAVYAMDSPQVTLSVVEGT